MSTAERRTGELVSEMVVGTVTRTGEGAVDEEARLGERRASGARPPELFELRTDGGTVLRVESRDAAVESAGPRPTEAPRASEPRGAWPNRQGAGPLLRVGDRVVVHGTFARRMLERAYRSRATEERVLVAERIERGDPPVRWGAGLTLYRRTLAWAGLVVLPVGAAALGLATLGMGAAQGLALRGALALYAGGWAYLSFAALRGQAHGGAGGLGFYRFPQFRRWSSEPTRRKVKRRFPLSMLPGTLLVQIIVLVQIGGVFRIARDGLAAALDYPYAGVLVLVSVIGIGIVPVRALWSAHAQFLRTVAPLRRTRPGWSVLEGELMRPLRCSVSVDPLDAREVIEETFEGGPVATVRTEEGEARIPLADAEVAWTRGDVRIGEGRRVHLSHRAVMGTRVRIAIRTDDHLPPKGSEEGSSGGRVVVLLGNAGPDLRRQLRRACGAARAPLLLGLLWCAAMAVALCAMRFG